LLITVTIYSSMSNTSAQEDLVRRSTAEIMSDQARSDVELNEQTRAFKLELTDESRESLQVNSENRSQNTSALAPIGFPRAPQNLGTEFTAVTLADTNAFPPQATGAVGPTQYVVTANRRIRVFNKESGAVEALDANLDEFFRKVMSSPPPKNYTSSPHVRYDRFTQKWIITAIDVPLGYINNRLLIAVSDGSTITATIWSYFYFHQNLAPSVGNTNCFLDFPTLGLDINALYVGGITACGQPLAYSGNSAWVIRKAFMNSTSSNLVAPTSYVTAFRNLTGTPNGAGPYAPQGVDNFDADAVEGYFIGVDRASFGTLVLRRVANPSSATPTLSQNIYVTVDSTRLPISVPHLGNMAGVNGNLSAGDDRLSSATVRNGRLWTAHSIAVNAMGSTLPVGNDWRNAIRWYEIQNLKTTPSVLQSGTIFDNSPINPLSYWIPALMVSGQGHTSTGFSVAGNTFPASAGTVGRLANDPLDIMRGIPLVYEMGSGNYNPPADLGRPSGRYWGNYSYTSLDPCDDMTMWTVQQFNNSLNSYGTRVVKLVAPPPPSLPSGPVITVNTGNPSIALELIGTSLNGEGFYDTPLTLADACKKSLTVIVTNNVLVNSLTFKSATTVEVNISTINATAGLATLTVINPDGQQVSTTITVLQTPTNTPTFTSEITQSPTVTHTSTSIYTLTPTSPPSTNTALPETATSPSTPNSAQSVVRFILVNAVTNQDIRTLNNGDVLDLSSLNITKLNIRAETTPMKVGSVMFALNDKAKYRVENFTPYALAGDTNGDYYIWTPTDGEYTLKATPYTAKNASGNFGASLEITFTVVGVKSKVSGRETNFNFVNNGDFEMLAENNKKLPYAWTAKKTSKGVTKCNEDASNFAYSGNCAFRFKGVVEGEVILQQIVYYSGNASVFNLSLWVNRKNVNGSAFVLAKATYRNGQKSRVLIPIPEGNYSYQEISQRISLEAIAEKVVIKIVFKSTTGRILIDDVKFTEATQQGQDLLLPLP
jgi:hypothetical protein